MKRIINSALVLLVSLIGLVPLGIAHADTTNTIALQLDAICSVSATGQAVFAAQNKNDFPVVVSYTNTFTGDTGTFTAPANSFDNFYVPFDASDPNNTTVFTADGWSSPVSTNAPESSECTATDLPVDTTPPSTTPIQGGSTTPTGTPPTDTPQPTGTSVDSGKGELPVVTASTPTITVPTATTTSSTPTDTVQLSANTPSTGTLADTGANPIPPMIAAAVILVVTLGVTFGVRTNRL